jgi:hypothetical protein
MGATNKRKGAARIRLACINAALSRGETVVVEELPKKKWSALAGSKANWTKKRRA